MTEFSLNTLEGIIRTRSNADAQSSYTAQLLAKGVINCAEKFGEEAVELALASVAKDKADIIHEAADALYHLLVLLQARNIPLKDVMRALEGRNAQSGLTEKARRSTEN